MAKSKTVDICGKKVEFRSSASIPRMYRIMFKRDIFKDLERLASAAKEVEDDGEDGFEIEDLELFENVAYCMAKHADPQIKSIDDWLDGFDMFSIYEKKIKADIPGIKYSFIPVALFGSRPFNVGFG